MDRRKSFGAFVAIAALVLAIVPAVAGAQTTTTDIKIVGNGENDREFIVFFPAENLQVPVSYIGSGGHGTITVEVTQPESGSSGFSVLPEEALCNGERHTDVVEAFSFGGNWVSGKAVVTVTLHCPSGTDTDERTINIQPKN